MACDGNTGTTCAKQEPAKDIQAKDVKRIHIDKATGKVTVVKKDGSTVEVGQFVKRGISAGATVIPGSRDVISGGAWKGVFKPDKALAQTNREQQAVGNPGSGTMTVIGSRAGTSRKINPEKVEIRLEISERNQAGGYKDVNSAVIAQLRAYEQEYNNTKNELTGIIIEKDGKYYFSNMVEVPTIFKATITLPRGYTSDDVAGYVHTHADNAAFSGLDYVTPANTGKPSFARNRRGQVFRWEGLGARSYRKRIERRKFGSLTSKLQEEVSSDMWERYQIRDLCSGGNLCRN